MTTLSVDGLVQDMATAMSDILEKDVTLLRGYAKAKAKKVARFTKLIAEGYADGEIDEAELEEELDELDSMIDRFVRNIKALARVTVEKLILAVTTTLYGAIKTVASGAGVPLPSLDMPE